MPKYPGYSNSTGDGHQHEVDMDNVESDDATKLMVECHKCGLQGGVSLTPTMLDEAAEWNEEPDEEESEEDEDEDDE